MKIDVSDEEIGLILESLNNLSFDNMFEDQNDEKIEKLFGKLALELANAGKPHIFFNTIHGVKE